MRKVYISEARCNSHLLHTSKRYRLHFAIQPPATVIGLRSPKSDYMEAAHETVRWKHPFGKEFTATPGHIGCRVAIDLRERRFGHSGQIVASCSLDLSSLTDKEICLELRGDTNNKLGELIICVVSSLAPTHDAAQNASQAVQQLHPGLPVVNDAIQAAAPLATEIMAQFDAWQPLLSRLAALVKVADAVAEVHPWIKLVWGVVSATYRIASVQSDRDTRVMGLVQTMADSCSFADGAEELKKRSERDQDIINQILRQVMECTYFIRDYCRDKSFAKRTARYMVSLVDVRIDNYKGTLETLRRNLIDHANIQCSVITHRVLDVVTEVRDLQVLSELKYAPEAHHDLDKGCLRGTRTKIIDAIVHWAVGADTPPFESSGSTTLGSSDSSRVLWLCGMAGAGKSSILRSCAKCVSDLERKGSYYGFDKNKPLANLTNLFGTIARDLADLDNSRKQRLVDAVKNDTALRTSDNCKLQFQHFIVKSFEDDKALGMTVVFIDAFDESGDFTARADALAILTKRASEFPPGLRIVVTSRYEYDIQEALRSPLPAGVEIMLVDDIPTPQTSADIATYIWHELGHVDDLREAESQTQVNALIRRAGTSFQWAATACRFICSIDAGVDPREQIKTVLDADEGLYPLYSTVMKERCDPSNKQALERVKSILGRIICAREPLSLRALVQLVPLDFIPMSDHLPQQIVKSLASVLSGTHSEHEPIAPLHSSYRDFLCNVEHNKDFYIDKGEANQQMALACFRVMDQNLTFNICQIPTSFVRNAAIPDMKDLREKHIPYHLYYACRFWGSHVSATPGGEFARKSLESFFRKDFLHWLEVMSLMESSPQTALTSLSISHIATDLIEEQQDAMQFISMFSGAIAGSMPHIYLSGLTFAPTSSLLYQRWQGQFPGVAKLVQGQLEHWPKIMLFIKGHHERVECVAFSPDGKQITSASADKTIQIWSVETGASIGQPMGGDNDTIYTIAFSPDGKWIASGSDDQTIQLWNVETGMTIGQPMKGHTGAVMSLGVSPDGNQIASGSLDKTIQLWNVKTGVSIGQPMKGHNNAISSIAFSPDGKHIASGSWDRTICLWNVEMGVRIGHPMKGHHDWIWSIAFSPDGKQIASGSADKTIQLWNVETGASIGHPMKGHHDTITSIAFSPDCKLIASGSFDKTIQFWNVETGASIGLPIEGDDCIWSIAFSPDGKLIASGSLHGSVQLWSVERGVSNGQLMKQPGHGIQSIAFSPDGKHIASGSLDETIQLWNAETGASVGQPMKGNNGFLWSIAFSPDGKQIASGSLYGIIELWNVETGVNIGQPMQGHYRAINSIAFSPDGKQIASSSVDSTQLWNAETGRSIGQPMKRPNHLFKAVGFSSNGKPIAASTWDKTTWFWNVETGASIGQPIEEDDSVTSKQIYSGFHSHSLHLWNAQPMNNVDIISSIAFSHDGTQIASSSHDHTIQLWDVETGASIGQPMKGHDDTIISIAFSPDGKHIASGSADQTMRLWNVAPTMESKPKLQYPPHLFPFPASPFRLDDGWILGPNDELILWVPAAHCASLKHPNGHIMGTHNNTEIDFQHLKCGKNWAQCRELEK